MKFTISKESFLEAIQQVQHVVSARTTLAILSNVLLRARDGHLELTTTDLDVGVTCGVPADVTEAGATTLPARRLATIVRELPAEEVEVSVDEKNVASIRSGPSYFKVLGLTSEEFPRCRTSMKLANLNWSSPCSRIACARRLMLSQLTRLGMC